MESTIEAPLNAATEYEQLRVSASGEVKRVDRNAKVIHGFVVAQLGAFRTAGRGEFDERALRQIVRLMKQDPDGLESFYGHPKAIDPEQLGRLLGRAKNPRIETITVNRNGEKMQIPAVLADLHLSPTAFENNPNGNIGGYVLDLAEHDPRSFAASLVVDAAKEHRLERGRQKLDENGNPLPPLWRPLALASIDVVKKGEAVDSFLPSRLSAAPDLFGALDSMLAVEDRKEAEAAFTAYLAYRYGETMAISPEMHPTSIIPSAGGTIPLQLSEPTTEQPSEPDSSLEDYLLADELEGVS